MHVREALHLLASSHFLASFLFLLRDIAHMIHIRYIAHMVQNLVKQMPPTELRLDTKLIRAQLGEEINMMCITQRINKLPPYIIIQSLWPSRSASQLRRFLKINSHESS